jgi:hypothetical protein
MAAVMTLQALHDYSDRETGEAVRFDVRWKAAIGASLDDRGSTRPHDREGRAGLCPCQRRERAGRCVQ